MFCKNCGVQLSDDARFCSSCGIAIGNDSSSNASVLTVTSNKNTKKKTIAFVVALMVVALAVLLIWGGDSRYEKTIENFFEGLFEADGELFLSSLSEEYIEEQLEYYGYRNKAVLIEKLQDNLDDLTEEYAYELGKNWKYKYEIVHVEEFDDEIEVTIDLELSGRKGEESDVWILVLIKDGNKWYVGSFDGA